MHTPSFVTRSPVNAQLGGFHLSATVNSVAVRVHVGILLELLFSAL